MSSVVVFHFRDNNGKRAEMRLHPSSPLNHGAALALANSAAPFLVALSDARLFKIEIRHSLDTEGYPDALPTSNVRRTGILFYRNGDGTASFSVPSIRRLYAEASGRYAGARITRDSLALQGMLDAVDTLLDGGFDPTIRPYGGTFSVGCIQDTTE